MDERTTAAQTRPRAPRDPEGTKARLLQAAREEFAQYGLGGARVSAIVDNAGVNKQLLYYYFGDKDSLYTAVLEQAYGELRIGEQALKLDDLPPDEAIRRFIEFNFDFLVGHPHFVSLLSDENLHKARHVKASKNLPPMHDRLRDTIGGALERGLADGTFKRDVDPVDLYITISSLCFFYQSNTHTMSEIFQRDLSAPAEIKRRREQILEMVLGYLMN